MPGHDRPTEERCEALYREIKFARAQGRKNAHESRSEGSSRKQHCLKLARCNVQELAGKAAVELIYVANRMLIKEVPVWERRLYASVDAAFIGENVYLFSAANSLATVFRGTFDHKQVERALKLDSEQFVVFAQSVGFSAAPE